MKSNLRSAAIGLCLVLLAGLLPTPASAAPSPPTGASPGTTDPNNPSSVTSLTPTLHWSASTGATGYFLNLRRMSDNVLLISERSVGSGTGYTMPSGDLSASQTDRKS